MKREMFTCLSIAIVFMSIVLLSGCKEDDTIDSPSSTSIMIKGKVYTTDGQPLPNIKVTLDYIKSAYLVPGALVTKHKAECTTDAKGMYKLYFEKRDDENISEVDGGVDMSIHKDYVLSFDVNKLKNTDYLMPSEVNGTESEELINFTYQTGALSKSGSYDKNVYIPKRRWVDVTVQSGNLLSSKDVYAINNTIYYADRDVSMVIPADLKGGVSGPFKIPCIVNDSNRISLQCLRGESGAYEPVSSVEKFKADSNMPADITLFNTYISSDTRFQLNMTSKSKHGTASFRMVEFYAADAGEQADNNINIWNLSTSSFAYYDSIVWGAKGYPDTELVYSKALGAEKRLISWGAYFFQNKPLYTYLYGYKDGRIAYTDSLLTDIKPKDFLGYNWNDQVDEQEQKYNAYYCLLWKGVDFIYNPLQKADGYLYSTVSLKMPNDTEDVDAYAKKATDVLTRLMNHHLGNAVETVDTSLFHCLPPAVKVLACWQTAATRAVLVKESQEEWPYMKIYVHAEPVE